MELKLTVHFSTTKVKFFNYINFEFYVCCLELHQTISYIILIRQLFILPIPPNILTENSSSCTLILFINCYRKSVSCTHVLALLYALT